jgi:hypothetical protein
MLHPDGLDHAENKGAYRIEAEFDDSTVEYFAEEDDVAEAIRNGLRKAGATVTITEWDPQSAGYNLRYGGDE